MSVRPLTPDDLHAAAGFILMAAFPPGAEPPRDALEHPHVRRWIENWGEELGVGWEEKGELRGAAWARRVEPVLARDDETGDALPELVIGVIDKARGAGVGRSLMEALLVRARADGCPGLALNVSERNPVAIRLYEQVGFVRHGGINLGLMTMVWSPDS